LRFLVNIEEIIAYAAYGSSAMIPGVSSRIDSSGLTIIAEADDSLRNFLYLGLAKKEMHPEDAF